MNKKLLISLLSFLFVQGVFAQSNQVVENKDGSKTFNQGHLVMYDGVPFLTVKGDAYEMGLQYGVLLNKQLIKMDNTVDSLVESYIGSFFIKKWIAGAVLNKKIKKIEKILPPEYLDELKGMADGSDLELKDLQLIAYFPQLFFKISCTAFILKNENGLVHGRNLDWPGIEVLTHFPLIVDYHKKDKIPVTVLTFMGYPGVYTGMNHSGLSMSINMNGTPPANEHKIDDYNTGMPLAFKLRNILENADKLHEVDELFRDYSSHAWFITVGSKKDNSGAIFELTRGEVIKNQMNNDFLYVANLSLSDVGRYSYSPIWMHGTSNISRERKLQELNLRIDASDLIYKSYKILTSTENHHLTHDPFYAYGICNSNTIKSCILDNMNSNIYFTYGERYAALNKYLVYNVNSGEIDTYQQKQEIADPDYFKARMDFQQWYGKQFSGKKKLDNNDYSLIIKQILEFNLQPAYQAYLQSYYYDLMKDYDNANLQAQQYILELPDFYNTYFKKYKIMRNKGDYMGAIVALEQMMQTSTINPYYEYLANVYMIEMYNELVNQKYDQIYVDKILKLSKHVRWLVSQYMIDKDTQKDLDKIANIEKKYLK